MNSKATNVLTLSEDTDTVTQPTCPTCEQPIAHQQIERVRRRIEAQEQARLKEIEAIRLEQEQASKAELTAKIAEIELTNSARLQEIEEAKVVELSTAIAQAKAEAEETSATQIQELETKRIAAELLLEESQTKQEIELEQRLTEQREALDEDKVKAVNAANALAFADKQKLEEKLSGLQRELDRQSARELGEGAEIDLYESLKQEFVDDRITRVKDGYAGADIIHQVINKGVICGTIVYDSKNRKQWRNSYSEKLRDDQIAAKADHAILTVHKFPAGRHQLCSQDGVIIVNPARAVEMAIILRKQIIQMNLLNLSADEREQKMVVLYDYINSEAFRNQMDKLDELAKDLLELEVKEQSAHQNTWTKRGSLIRSIQRTYGHISNDVDCIVTQTEYEEDATG
jgi:hypothetical protein